MKHYLFLLVFFLVACSSDDEYIESNSSCKIPPKGYAVSMSNGNVVCVDPLTFNGINEQSDLETYMCQNQNSPRVLVTYDETELVDSGYTDKSRAQSPITMTLNTGSPIRQYLGLAPGTYIYEIVLVRKRLSVATARDNIDVISPNEDNHDMGTQNAAINGVVGWKTDENPENGDMLFFGKTYLVHVISTYGGVPIDRYYPCSPQDLMWRYVSKHRVN